MMIKNFAKMASVLSLLYSAQVSFAQSPSQNLPKPAGNPYATQPVPTQLRSPAQTAIPGSPNLGAVAGPAGQALGKPGVSVPGTDGQVSPAAAIPTPIVPPPPAADMVIDPNALNEKVKDIALIKTSLGDIKIRLYSKVAPKNVENFKALAKGDKEFLEAKSSQRVRRPFYNGLTFHRVVKGFVIATGCPLANGKGGPGYAIPDELSPILRHNKAGMVSMANVGKDSNGSQFFITLGPRPEFDDKYTIIGEVIEGMDVVKAINKVRVGPTDRPIQKVEISSIEIEKQ